MAEGRSAAAPREAAHAEPLVVAARVQQELQVAAADEAGLKAGLIVGMPLATARAMLPALDIVEQDAAADAVLLEAIARWCDRFTPLVALDTPDGLFLDITGCAHLFGGEAAMMRGVCASLARQGFGICAAIAGTPLAARALARTTPGRVIASGEEAVAVRPLPVSALGVSDEIQRLLRRAGLKTIGDVAARQPAELAARCGPPFVDRLQQVLGFRDAPISPRRPVPDYMVEKRFAEPVATSDAITLTLSALGKVLVEAMGRRGQGARQLEAAFFRTDGAVRAIGVEAGQPVSDAVVLMRLFAERLDALADPLDPGFGFDLIRLSAICTVGVTPQQRGFDTAAHEADDVAQLVDQLAARLGSQRVVRYVPQETHCPERADLPRPAQESLGDARPWPARVAGEPPLRPLRLFAPPEPIGVTAEVPHGPPARFNWRRTHHLLAHVEGPERIATEWWRPGRNPLTRDYFRVEDTAGRRFWIFRDGLYDVELEGQDGRPPEPAAWYLHGVFA